MEDFNNQETVLIQIFLETYKKVLNEQNVPFNPRSLTIVSQPDLTDSDVLHTISYSKWFDEMGVDVQVDVTGNLLEAYLNIPVGILMNAEDVGKPLLSKNDRKKLVKALKLLSEIKLEQQNEKS